MTEAELAAGFRQLGRESARQVARTLQRDLETARYFR
jgi:hypothetical protein